MRGLLDGIGNTSPDSDQHAGLRMAGRLRCLSVWGRRGGVQTQAAEAGGAVALLDILLTKLLFPEVRC